MGQIIVLSKKPYSFVDRDNRTIEGCKIQYVDPNLSDDSIQGRYVFDCNLEIEMDSVISKVPAVYDANFATVIKNKLPVLIIKDMKLLKEFPFNVAQ